MKTKTEMKITLEIDTIKLATRSNKVIMGYFNSFMEACCDEKETEEYQELLALMGKWLDEARDGYGLKR
jgi:hypothetical protein